MKKCRIGYRLIRAVVNGADMPYLAMVLLILSILCALVGFADDGAGKGTAVARALAMVSGVSFLVVVVLAALRGRSAVEKRDQA